ncbi:uncharacterized protein E5676_scaffold600G002050 [Cucumis melo var. makuwa]|uniref:CACTA en-spm transposon protein n=1 Tax=Cucumis melo var. makuwa TaxID=1194695 RepID=A0A5A7TYB4_CUCMM|nr:uncharacterized protein E6C27_scaffold61G001970 [Cucumis melo var. makuwa]TYK28365.1 uncharacterized protein E5676_scaffold600G002050 [Cucumis melo var. makuwa]
MRWHKDKRVDTEDVLRHPTDAARWKHFDKEFPQFASEPRNVHLSLASDGFIPFGNMSTAYSISPGKELDVYLQPLIDELKELWNNGVRTFDYTDEDRQRDDKFECRPPPVVMSGDEILQQVTSINFPVLKCATNEGSVVRTLSEDEKRMCCWYVLNSCCQIESYRRGDVEPTVVDHEETDNQDQSRIDDDFINDETEQLESSNSDDQARLALTEVEQTNTLSVNPSTPSGSQSRTKN